MGSWRTSSEYRSELTSVYLAIFRAEDELDDKLKSQEKELRKISTGSSLGKVFLDTVRQREKINAGKRETSVRPGNCDIALQREELSLIHAATPGQLQPPGSRLTGK